MRCPRPACRRPARATRPPGGSPVDAAVTTFALLLLVDKVYSPQYMLWLFAFGVIAQWPVWSLVLMSVAGLVDYADAMTALYLSHTHSPAFSWFFHTLYPWNTSMRNATVAIGLVQALPHGGRPQARVSNARQEPSPLPH